MLGILNLSIMLGAVCFEGPVLSKYPQLGLSELYAPIFFLTTICLYKGRLAELSKNKKIPIYLFLAILIMAPREQAASSSYALIVCKLTYLILISVSVALNVDTPFKLRIAIFATPICSFIGALIIAIAENITPNAAYDTYFLYRNHPYLGETRQLMGFSKTPNNLALNLVPLLICMALQTLYEKTRKTVFLTRIAICIILLLATTLTQSKSLMLGFILTAFVAAGYYGMNNTLQKTLFGLGLVIYFGMIHFVFLTPSADSSTLVGEFLGSRYPILQLNGLNIFTSQYLLLKQIAFDAFLKYTISGIGLGEFGTYAEHFAVENNAHLHTTNPLPHSLYISFFAECGILAGTIFLLFSLWLIKENLLRISTSHDDQITPNHIFVRLGILFFLIEGVNLDVQYNRYFWILIGSTIAISQSWRPENSKPMTIT